MQFKSFSQYVKEFERQRLKQILKNGELFMFDSRLTKEEHDKIVKSFEQIISSNEEALKENVKEEKEPQQDDIEKLINLKNFS